MVNGDTTWGGIRVYTLLEFHIYVTSYIGLHSICIFKYFQFNSIRDRQELLSLNSALGTQISAQHFQYIMCYINAMY